MESYQYITITRSERPACKDSSTSALSSTFVVVLRDSVDSYVVFVLIVFIIITHRTTQTHTYIYIYVCVCVCVCAVAAV